MIAGWVKPEMETTVRVLAGAAVVEVVEDVFVVEVVVGGANAGGRSKYARAATTIIATMIPATAAVPIALRRVFKPFSSVAESELTINVSRPQGFPIPYRVKGRRMPKGDR